MNIIQCKGPGLRVKSRAGRVEAKGTVCAKFYSEREHGVLDEEKFHMTQQCRDEAGRVSRPDHERPYKPRQRG